MTQKEKEKEEQIKQLIQKGYSTVKIIAELKTSSRRITEMRKALSLGYHSERVTTRNMTDSFLLNAY